ncbi:uncharacterized protein LOC125239487 [Leguminivora glycinivorella]|uniref:uncharacterized protein LOC125239487 n=1 Tax=Leguminivora glycinivorella TaxID=1035111 RepID=UPI00200E00E1|nr:uncharacterized protein LOC125239487 [Leguminivora glycinivorella]
MQQYIEAVTTLVQKLDDIGRTTEDAEVAELLLSGLPQEYDVLVSSLEAASLTKTLTSEMCLLLLRIAPKTGLWTLGVPTPCNKNTPACVQSHHTPTSKEYTSCAAVDATREHDCALTTSDVPAHIWHRRLSHLSKAETSVSEPCTGDEATSMRVEPLNAEPASSSDGGEQRVAQSPTEGGAESSEWTMSPPDHQFLSCSDGEESEEQSPASEHDVIAQPSTGRPIRSTRGIMPNRYGDYDLSLMAHIESEPLFYHEAMASDNCDNWKAAMQKEYNALVNNNVWRLVDRPKHTNIVKCKWVYKVKSEASEKTNIKLG